MKKAEIEKQLNKSNRNIKKAIAILKAGIKPKDEINFDTIVGKDIDEMAQFIYSIEYPCDYCKHYDCSFQHKQLDCLEGVTAWLRMPVIENNKNEDENHDSKNNRHDREQGALDKGTHS